MRELIKRVDPMWLYTWLVVYGGSLSVLAVYLMTVILRFGGEQFGIGKLGN